MLLQNMDRTVDPCDDFYKFTCGGFEERTVIPDDRSGWSQFSVIGKRSFCPPHLHVFPTGKKLQQQLRALLETPPPAAEAKVFSKARGVYMACMDERRIEEIGLEPLKERLHQMGGWPVLEGAAWNEDAFSWIDTTYKFRKNSYSTDLLIDFSIVTDSKNSSYKVIDIDQASLGQSQVFLVKGLEEHRVAAYYKYMVNVAVLMGAERSNILYLLASYFGCRRTAEKEMMEALEFEMTLAHASMPREMRRNATRLYNPMMIRLVDF